MRLDGSLLESLSFHNNPVISRSNSIETEVTCIPCRISSFNVGLRVKKRDLGVRYDRSGLIGDGPFNAAVELGEARLPQTEQNCE
jgi:hypothetical protein